MKKHDNSAAAGQARPQKMPLYTKDPLRVEASKFRIKQYKKFSEGLKLIILLVIKVQVILLDILINQIEI